VERQNGCLLVAVDLVLSTGNLGFKVGTRAAKTAEANATIAPGAAALGIASLEVAHA
jgi:hypothetical protein